MAAALCGICLLASTTWAFDASATPGVGTTGYLPSGPVGEAGRWLVDTQGRVLLVHGVNVVAKDAPYYPSAFGFDDADAQWLAGKGLYLVRLGVLASGEMPTRGKIDETYIAKLVATVDDLGRHHIFSLLDWHQDDYGTYFNTPKAGYGGDGFPSWMTVTGGVANKQVAFPLDYLSNPALQHAFQSFWDDTKVPGGHTLQSYDLQMLKAVAEKVAGNPWVLGYEVMNEPWPGTTWLPCASAKGCPALERSELEPYYRRAAAAIRSVDPRHMIFFEPFVSYNFGTTPTSLTLPPGVSNTGLAFHQYAQSPQTEEDVFTRTAQWSKTHKGALLNTEWSDVGGDPATIKTQAGDENTALMPWTYWVFDNCEIACSSAKAANLILDPKSPPSGANVNAPIVDSVVEAYPVAVAGTPQHLSFDYTTDVMSFSWTTSRAKAVGRARGFGAGSVTVFAVPKMVYPHGYVVQVTGGKVVSPKNSPTLAVAQTGRPAEVSVKVTPLA